MSQGIHLRKYGVAATIDFELYEVDGVDFRTDWTPAAGDVFMMRDEAAEEQVTNAGGGADLSTLITDEGRGYSITLALEDMQAARVVVYLVDQATKAFLDKVLIIETYGNASAQHAFDLDTASAAQSADNDTKLDTIITGVNVTSEANIDFGAAKKASLNAATTNLTAITGDKASYKATGFSTHNAAAVKTAMEVDGGKLDHLWEMTEDDTGTRRLTTNALEQAPDSDTTSGLTLHSDYDAAKSAAPAGEYDTEMARITGDVALASGVDVTKISGDTTAANNLESEYDGTGYIHILRGTNIALDTTLAVRTSDTVFTITAGSGDNDAYKNMVLALYDVTGTLWQTRKIDSYVGVGKTVTVDTAFTFVVANGDYVRIFQNAYAPTVAAGGGATAQQVHEYVVTGITTPGLAGYEIQQRGGSRYG